MADTGTANNSRSSSTSWRKHVLCPIMLSHCTWSVDWLNYFITQSENLLLACNESGNYMLIHVSALLFPCRCFRLVQQMKSLPWGQAGQGFQTRPYTWCFSALRGPRRVFRVDLQLSGILSYNPIEFFYILLYICDIDLQELQFFVGFPQLMDFWVRMLFPCRWRI